MGHDIGSGGAYLRRGAGDEGVNRLYEVLGCEKHNGGSSGTGDDILVGVDAVWDAIDELKKDRSLSREDRTEFIEFLLEALRSPTSAMNGAEYVLIRFG